MTSLNSGEPPSPAIAEKVFAWESEASSSALVTVVVPVHNYAHYVCEALESVHSQTLAEIDLIIVDDASTDNSAQVVTAWLEEHHKRFSKATFFQQSKNSGLSVVRNLGFAQARTEFVFPLDADNMIYPHCLEKMARALSGSRCAFAYCIIERFGSAGEHRDFPLFHLRQWEPASLADGNYIDAMSLFRKQTWEAAGGYTEPHRYGWEDYEMWFKIARINGSGLHIPQILARYRVHNASMLNTVTNVSDAQELLRRYLRDTYPEFFAK